MFLYVILQVILLKIVLIFMLFLMQCIQLNNILAATGKQL